MDLSKFRQVQTLVPMSLAGIGIGAVLASHYVNERQLKRLTMSYPEIGIELERYRYEVKCIANSERYISKKRLQRRKRR